jgi:hypothetical protein
MSDSSNTHQKLVEVRGLKMWFPIMRGILQKHVSRLWMG